MSWVCVVLTIILSVVSVQGRESSSSHVRVHTRGDWTSRYDNRDEKRHEDDNSHASNIIKLKVDHRTNSAEYRRLRKDNPQVSDTPWAVAGFSKLFQSQGALENKGNVFVATSEKDVLHRMQEAVDNGHTLSIISGGHGYEGYGTSKDVIIDMALYEGLERERIKGFGHVVSIRGGTKLQTVYSHLYQVYRTLIPGGSCYSVGAGGHITGGGYGLFSRMFGLTVDYVIGVRFAYVAKENNKKIVKVVDAFFNSDSNELRELLWACRGSSCANYGVILKYYLPGKLDKNNHLMLMPKVPPFFSQVTVTLVGEADDELTLALYKKLYSVFWHFYKDEGRQYPNVFGFFRANRAGVQIFASAASFGQDGKPLSEKQVMADLLYYISQFLAVLPEACQKSAKVEHCGAYGIKTTWKEPVHVKTPTPIQVIGDQVDTYNFLDYVQINNGADPNSYFKNSGHVLRKDAGGGEGYTPEQLQVIFDRVLQKYELVDHLMHADTTLVVRDDVYRGPIRKRAVSRKGKTIYLRKTPQSQEGARTQWGWLSQHKAQQNQDTDYVPIKDYNVHFVYQHDPNNGAAANLYPNKKNPIPFISKDGRIDRNGAATSVASREINLKMQPQLYWDFEEDSDFMLNWFDDFTDSLFSSSRSSPLRNQRRDLQKYPVVDGLYINYPDTHYMDMYPAKKNSEGKFEEDSWPFLYYGNGNELDHGGGNFIERLQSVKAIFDPSDEFTLTSKKRYQKKSTPSLSLPLRSGK